MLAPVRPDPVSMQDPLSRRDIIKTVFVLSATSLIENKLWAKKIVGDVKAFSPDPTQGFARIDLAAFPAMTTNGGSVRLGSSNIMRMVNPGMPDEFFPVGIFYPITINRVSATEYVAIEANCLHSGCVVGAFTGSVASGRMICPCHGSEYDIRGACTHNPTGVSGQVGKSLTKYPTTLHGTILTFKYPVTDLGLVIHQTSVVSASGKRLMLTWESFADVEYEIRWRP